MAPSSGRSALEKEPPVSAGTGSRLDRLMARNAITMKIATNGATAVAMAIAEVIGLIGANALTYKIVQY